MLDNLSNTEYVALGLILVSIILLVIDLITGDSKGDDE